MATAKKKATKKKGTKRKSSAKAPAGTITKAKARKVLASARKSLGL